MLVPEPISMKPGEYPGCDYCQEPAVIEMHGYGDGPSGTCRWCVDCGLQLVRKVTEDLCELLTASGRHG
jgi:hypothetical protein